MSEGGRGREKRKRGEGGREEGAIQLRNMFSHTCRDILHPLPHTMHSWTGLDATCRVTATTTTVAAALPAAAAAGGGEHQDANKSQPHTNTKDGQQVRKMLLHHKLLNLF